MWKVVGWLGARQWLGWNDYRCRRNTTRTSWVIGQGSTRYAHQVTALSLSILRKHAYARYTAVCEENGAELLSFKPWCIPVARQQGTPIQILANGVTYDMDMLMLRFVRSIRTVSTCFSTRSHWMKSQIGRSFSITTTTLAGSQSSCATWWTCEWNTRLSIDRWLWIFHHCQNAKPFLND